MRNYKNTMIKTLVAFCFTLAAPLAILADEKAEAVDKEIAQVVSRLKLAVPSLEISSIQRSPMPGVYEVFTAGQLLYISADAKFLISGKLFSIENGVNDLTAQSMRQLDMRLAPLRQEKVSALDEKDMVIFKAADEKYQITVFTDVDCAFCRKLHKEMPNYNKLGITIRYLGFPRAGLGSSSHVKLESIWCAPDRNEAMNRAKNDRVFGTDTCENPLGDHFELVREFNINGTPAIILKSGQYLPGFVKADQLLKIIEEDEANSQKSDAKAG